MKQICLEVDNGENFTPAGLMNRYAKQNPGIFFYRSFWGNARLSIAGHDYEYHHWMITAENGKTFVTLFIEEVKSCYQRENITQLQDDLLK